MSRVAEIRGSEKPDEVVMLGGHLDSWASATGATDNAIGCAVMMEAARILQTVGAKPRRTIRVALWSGEEQGLLGSIAYVREHFGMVEAPKPEHAKLDAYWNIDGGSGRVRGASIFGPPQGGAILGQFLKPWEEWGRIRRVNDGEPHDGRHRQHVVQSGRPARHRRRSGVRSNTGAPRITRTSTPTSASCPRT